MRVVHVTAPARVGGLESVVEALAAGQLCRGHDPHVVAALSPKDAEGDHPFLDRLRQSGISVHEIVASGWNVRSEQRQLVDLLGEVGPDVLHTHGIRSDLITGWALSALALPAISTQHGISIFTLRARLLRRVQRRVLRRFAGVIAVSQPLHDQLIAAGIDVERAHLVPNAWTGGDAFLDPDMAGRELGVPFDAPHIGWVGRISHEKGPDVFIDTLAGFERSGRRLTVSIIGDGALRSELQASTRDYEHVDVRWHGTVPGASRVFRAFDAIVLSSRTEGTPIVLLEAMAAGVPIVATRVGGVPDVINDTQGLLVPPLDPQALATAIEDALDRPVLAERRTQEARVRLERDFGAEEWLREHDRIYRRAVVQRDLDTVLHR